MNGCMDERMEDLWRNEDGGECWMRTYSEDFLDCDGLVALGRRSHFSLTGVASEEEEEDEMKSKDETEDGNDANETVIPGGKKNEGWRK